MKRGQDSTKELKTQDSKLCSLGAPNPDLPRGEPVKGTEEREEDDGAKVQRSRLVAAVLTLIEDHAAVFQNIRPVPKSK